MDILFNEIQKMNKERFKSFLGKKLLGDVMFAYETTFGAKEFYNEHLLDTIVDEYLSSDEEKQKGFCKCIEHIEATHLN